MNINETLSDLRGSLAEGGVGAVVTTLQKHFSAPTTTAVLWELQQEGNALLRDYLRGHVTAWDVLTYLMLSFPKLFDDSSPFRELGRYEDAGPLVFFDGELLREGAEYAFSPSMSGGIEITLHTRIPTNVVEQLSIIYATPEGFLRVEVHDYYGYGSYNFNPP
jgi:hypothetical protein